MPESEDPLLVEMICSALEQRERGVEPDLESLCKGRRDLLPALSDALQRAGYLPELHQRIGAGDPLLDSLLSGRYRILSRIGAGSMGVVYRGIDEELGRPIAVKIMQAEALAFAGAEARFVREAEALAAVRHPAVVAIHDRGRTGSGALYLVMDLLTGAPLVDIVHEAALQGLPGEQDPLDWLAREFGPGFAVESSYLRTVVSWTADLAAGLVATHECGVLHRDVKPSNVFIQTSGKPVLFDFGIATRHAQQTVGPGAAIGTPAYMAPEMLQGDRKLGPGVDVWGLCATLYHALTLHPPYRGFPAQVMAALARRDPIPAGRIRPGIPRDLQAILDRGLARKPEARYPDARSLESDLRAFLEHRPVSARYLPPGVRRLRTAWRSNAVRAVAALALCFVVMVSLSSWRVTRAEERDARGLDAWARLPPALTLHWPQNRVIEDESERVAAQVLLDRAVALRADPVQPLLFRAAFALDHGQPGDAARDMQALADRVDTAYARELAARYKALAPDAQGFAALDLSQLPAAVGRQDRYLEAYGQVRAANGIAALAPARETLDDPDLLTYEPAMELAILVELTLVPLEPSRQLRFAAANRVVDLVARLEERISRRTAFTAHLAGAALIFQERYAEALQPIREGLEITPTSHGLYISLGIATRRLGQLDQAREALVRAIDLKPSALNSYETLARVQVEQGDFDEALATVARAPFPGTDEGSQNRAILAGQVQTSQALARWSSGDGDAAEEAARAALRCFDEAESDGARYDGWDRMVCNRLLQGDPTVAFGYLIERIENDADNWMYLQRAAEVMPDDLSREETQLLRRYLQRLVDLLSPHTLTR